MELTVNTSILDFMNMSDQSYICIRLASLDRVDIISPVSHSVE